MQLLHNWHATQPLQTKLTKHHLWIVGRRRLIMERKMFGRLNNRFAHVFTQLSTAVRVSAALRVSHQPKAADLEALGINASEFRKIHG